MQQECCSAPTNDDWLPAMRGGPSPFAAKERSWRCLPVAHGLQQLQSPSQRVDPARQVATISAETARTRVRPPIGARLSGSCTARVPTESSNSRRQALIQTVHLLFDATSKRSMGLRCTAPRTGRGRPEPSLENTSGSCGCNGIYAKIVGVHLATLVETYITEACETSSRMAIKFPHIRSCATTWAPSRGRREALGLAGALEVRPRTLTIPRASAQPTRRGRRPRHPL